MPRARFINCWRHRADAAASSLMDLKKNNIDTILWAPGYRPDHSWLNLPVFDHKTRIRHHGGIVSTTPVCTCWERLCQAVANRASFTVPKPMRATLLATGYLTWARKRTVSMRM